MKSLSERNPFLHASHKRIVLSWNLIMAPNDNFVKCGQFLEHLDWFQWFFLFFLDLDIFVDGCICRPDL
jgi:hypothetical protein